MNAVPSAIERIRLYEMRVTRDQDERARDERERKLRAEMERLEAVVRSMRAAIDEECRDNNREDSRKGHDEPPQCHAD